MRCARLPPCMEWALWAHLPYLLLLGRNIISIYLDKLARRASWQHGGIWLGRATSGCAQDGRPLRRHSSLISTSLGHFASRWFCAATCTVPRRHASTHVPTAAARALHTALPHRCRALPPRLYCALHSCVPQARTHCRSSPARFAACSAWRASRTFSLPVRLRTYRAPHSLCARTFPGGLLRAHLRYRHKPAGMYRTRADATHAARHARTALPWHQRRARAADRLALFILCSGVACGRATLS